jgi:predicted glycoside hydrolase/deacetylase ChbG (UPF0249 family)
VQLETRPASCFALANDSAYHHGNPGTTGLLIVNADDWGRNRHATDCSLECVMAGAVSSVSAMVFMEDSERAAAIAQERGIDVGIHLNFTTPFSEASIPSRLAHHQQRLARHLLKHRFAPVLFHPGLIRSFEYVVATQFAEFVRLYGTEPKRIDGHHHMHLCANVVLAKLLPRGTLIRRNFSFEPGEKSYINRLYRRMLDRMVERQHYLVDFLFSLPPLEPAGRLQKIFSLARNFAVEVECHPCNPSEYKFLTGGEIFRQAGDVRVAPGFTSLTTRGTTIRSGN